MEQMDSHRLEPRVVFVLHALVVARHKVVTVGVVVPVGEAELDEGRLGEVVIASDVVAAEPVAERGRYGLEPVQQRPEDE